MCAARSEEGATDRLPGAIAALVVLWGTVVLKNEGWHRFKLAYQDKVLQMLVGRAGMDPQLGKVRAAAAAAASGSPVPAAASCPSPSGRTSASTSRGPDRRCARKTWCPGKTTRTTRSRAGRCA